MVVQEMYLDRPLAEREAFDTGVWVPICRKHTWLAGRFSLLMPSKTMGISLACRRRVSGALPM